MSVYTQVYVDSVGRRVVGVTCDHCKTKYFYELARVGIGESTTLLWLGKRTATEAARQRSLKKLDHLLAEEADLVPCPKCHWIPSELVERVRSRMYRSDFVSGALEGLVVFLLGLAAASGMMQAFIFLFGKSSAIAIPGGFLAALVVWTAPFWVRHWLRARFDPNRRFPLPPISGPGTPPALYEEEDPETGERRYVPAPVPTPEKEEQVDAAFDTSNPWSAAILPDDGPWAIFRSGQIDFPRVCCVCLLPATKDYSPLFQLRAGSDMPVPVCNSCSRTLRVRWFLIAVACAVVVVLLAIIASVFVKPKNAFAGAFWGIIITVAIVPNMLCRPYSIGVVRSDAALFRFRAKNRHYTQLLMDVIQQATEAERKISDGK